MYSRAIHRTISTTLPLVASTRSLSRTAVMLSTNNERLPVIIVGSGLGGLTLAHSLKKHNIPYRIFEKDGDADQRAQGYRVSIDEGGAGGLKNAVDPETFELFEKTCAASSSPAGRIDGPTGKVLQKGIPGLLGSGGLWMIPALMYRFLSKRWEKSGWTGLATWMQSWGMSWTTHIYIYMSDEADADYP